MKLIRVLSLFSLISVALIGCGSFESEVNEKPINRELSARIEDYSTLSTLSIANGKRSFKLGETPEKALTLFPRPSRGFPIEENIPGFPEALKARGWETNQEGFGVIFRDEQVLLAMHQFEGLEVDQFAELLVEVQAATPGAEYSKSTKDETDIWWCTDGRDVLMISRTPNKKKKYQVTVTLGNRLLVDALGMTKLLLAATPEVPKTVEPVLK
jgi:hypothetical protein